MQVAVERKTRKPKSPAARVKDMRVWKHNSFMGHARMMQMQANAIINSDTASVYAKRTAGIIYEKAILLGEELRAERIDPK